MLVRKFILELLTHSGAAAVEQISYGASVRVFPQATNGLRPVTGAVFDTLQSAKANGADVVIIDTAIVCTIN